MARMRAAAVALAITASVFVPGVSAAGPLRERFFNDCFAQEILLPITRDQAQSYLPKGFTPSVGAAEQQTAVYFQFMNIHCGDMDLPTLELVVSYIAVRPPKRFDHPDMPEIFVLDLLGSGSELDVLTRALCAEGLVGAAEITSVQGMERSDFAFSRASTSVVSDQLDASFHLVGNGVEGNGGGDLRWIYEREGTFRYFDSAHSTNHLSIGGSSVVFDEAYRDLPPAAAGFGFYLAHEQMMFVPQRGCPAR